MLQVLMVTALLSAERAADVVIYGGTSGGVAAAVQAKRMGKSVVLIEPSRHLGGLTTGGLGATDIGNKRCIGGISREFYQRIRQHYDQDSAWIQEQKADFKGRGHEPKDDAGWTFEPHVAMNIYRQMLAEIGVQPIMNERLNLKTGVKKDSTRIVSITCESGNAYVGKMFIDATYEGDLLAKAGVSYHVGREANSVYDETLNGIQIAHTISHQFIKQVDPFVIPGDRSSGLLPLVNGFDPGVEFAGDHRIQAYNYRMCTTDVPENRLPWPKPANYDEKRYELALRNVEAGDHRLSWNPVWMPNRKTDTNNNFAISTDHIGANYDYPEADYARREAIINDHISYQMGLIWTYANHPRVPEKIRDHFTKLGLAKDEFLETNHWPAQMYVREARRMIGGYVMAEANCRRKIVVEDSVGMGAYNMDSHNCQRYVTADGFARNEGDVQVGTHPYPISVKSITPKPEQCTNLTVPVCLSASHIAYGSIRMEPVFMVMGQSAATIACLAIDRNQGVQQLDYEVLKQRLLDDKQVLDFEVNTTRPKVDKALGRIDPTKLKGLVLDDDDADLKGFDTTSSSNPYFVGAAYRHDGNAEKGSQSATFVFKLKEAGEYEVRVSYSQNSNRATNVPVTITHAAGVTKKTVDQKQTPTIDKAFVSLGTYKFEPGKATVVISNENTDGYVLVDAVQLVAGDK